MMAKTPKQEPFVPKLDPYQDATVGKFGYQWGKDSQGKTIIIQQDATRPVKEGKK